MKPKILTERLSINLLPKQHRYLKEQAIIKNKTVSEIVRDLIDKERTRGQ